MPNSCIDKKEKMSLAFRKFFCTCALWLCFHTAPSALPGGVCRLPQPPLWWLSSLQVFLYSLPGLFPSAQTCFFQNEMFLMAPPCPPATGPLLCSTSWRNYLKIVSAGCFWFLPLVGPQSHFHSHYSTEQNYLVGWINHQFGI